MNNKNNKNNNDKSNLFNDFKNMFDYTFRKGRYPVSACNRYLIMFKHSKCLQHYQLYYIRKKDYSQKYSLIKKQTTLSTTTISHPSLLHI